MRTDRGILPSEDPRRTSSVLQRAVQAVEADRNTEAEQILQEVVEFETELSCQVVHIYPFVKMPGDGRHLAVS